MTTPGNRAKLAAVEQLTALAAEASLPAAPPGHGLRPSPSGGDVGHHRAPSPEHLDDLLAGAEVDLDEGVLDRVDEMCHPGSTSIGTTSSTTPRHWSTSGCASAA